MGEKKYLEASVLYAEMAIVATTEEDFDLYYGLVNKYYRLLINGDESDDILDCAYDATLKDVRDKWKNR